MKTNSISIKYISVDATKELMGIFYRKFQSKFKVKLHAVHFFRRFEMDLFLPQG